MDSIPSKALESLPADYVIVTEETYNPDAPCMCWEPDGRGWVRFDDSAPYWERGFYAQAVGDVKR